jgi:hypothetical protein
MEIIATLQVVRKGEVHIHFHPGGLPNDVRAWSVDLSGEEIVEVLKALQEYLKAEIEKEEKE